MARPKNVVPTYKKHPNCNQARCWVAGAWVYLGDFNSPESLEAYRRVCAEITVSSAPAVAARATGRAATVNELLLAFLKHAAEFYRRPDGTPTNEVNEYKQALRVVRRLYGSVPAGEFGPVALAAVRDAMVRKDWCRTRINKQVGRIRRCWKWGASKEIVTADAWVALGTLEGLRKNRSPAKETAPVRPVEEADYQGTLPHLMPTPRAMVQLQRAAGLRPCEVRLLVPADLDTSGDLWLYKPDEHKMAHLGITKAIPLPPSARAIIEPRLAGRGPRDYLFTPAEAREEWYAARRARRTCPLYPSEKPRRSPPAKHKKKWTTRFSSYGYAQCVRKACRRAGVTAWTPNQLRHSFGTEVRERFGLEVAQVLLGHKNAKTTEIYAEAALAKGKQAAKEMG